MMKLFVLVTIVTQATIVFTVPVELTQVLFYFNATLDKKEDVDSGTLWSVPKNSVPLWLEYHTDTTFFQSESGDSRKCANALNENELGNLSNVSGIWVACQDRFMPEGCQYIPDYPCYPQMKFLGRRPETVRTIITTFAIYGLAVLRLTHSENWQGHRCFDYGYKADPFSPCKFIEIDGQHNGWRRLVFTYDYGANISFGTFDIQLISRFSKDVIVIDKIEAIDSLLCDDDDTSCELLPSPVPSTVSPTTTTKTESTAMTTTEHKDPVDSTNSTLDALDINGTVPTGWKTSTNIKHYLEYYNDTAEFKNLQDNEGTCAHYMSKEKLNALSDVNGIWVACQDQSQPPDCDKFDQYAPCNAFISYDSRNAQNPTARTIKVSFAVEELAILRLTVKGTCTDYGRRIDPYSPCQFIQTKDEDANHGWHKIRFSFYPDLNGVFRGFTLQLITRFQHDVILIDKVEATDYLLCGPLEEEINCPTPPTTPRPTFTTTTTFITTPVVTTDKTEATSTTEAATTEISSTSSSSPDLSSETPPTAITTFETTASASPTATDPWGGTTKTTTDFTTGASSSIVSTTSSENNSTMETSTFITSSESSSPVTPAPSDETTTSQSASTTTVPTESSTRKTTFTTEEEETTISSTTPEPNSSSTSTALHISFCQF